MLSNLSRAQKIMIGAAGGAVVAAVITILAVSGGGDTPPTTTSTTSTTLGNPAPLTGLPASDPAVFQRPAVAGKIGNNPEARPQVALNDADIVYEEEVEGRITRFLAVFHSTLPERFGPVRSVRVMDPLIVQPFGGIFGYSGGAAGVVSNVTPRFAGAGITVFDESRAAGAGGTVLDRSHSNGVRPNILFYLPQKLIDAVGSVTPPNPVFGYVGPGETFSGGSAETVVVPVGSSGYNPTWRWSASKKAYERSYGDQPFLTNGGEQVSAHNIVVQFVGQGETLALGSGEAWVFSSGQFRKGTWSREDPAQPARFVDEAGVEIRLTPGRTWVEMPLAGAGSVRVID